MANNSRYRDQLESLYGISAQIASLRDLTEVYDLALTFCLALTASEMGFIDLLNEGHVDMDVVAVKGFAPPDPEFYERFKRMPVRPSVFGIVITEGRPHISNDVENDPVSVGEPPDPGPLRAAAGAAELAQAVSGLVRIDGCRLADSDPLAPLARDIARSMTEAGLAVYHCAQHDPLYRLGGVCLLAVPAGLADGRAGIAVSWAAHNLLLLDWDRYGTYAGTQQAMNTGLGGVLRVFGYPVTPFGSGGAWLVTSRRGTETGR